MSMDMVIQHSTRRRIVHHDSFGIVGRGITKGAGRDGPIPVSLAKENEPSRLVRQRWKRNNKQTSFTLLSYTASTANVSQLRTNLRGDILQVNYWYFTSEENPKTDNY